jgi:hypothetical protein
VPQFGAEALSVHGADEGLDLGAARRAHRVQL